MRQRGTDQLLIALTDGQIVWDRQRGDFDWSATDALPDCLRGAFPVRAAPRGPARNQAERGPVAGEPAVSLRHCWTWRRPVRGIAKNQLDNEDVKRNRMFRLLVRAGVTRDRAVRCRRRGHGGGGAAAGAAVAVAAAVGPVAAAGARSARSRPAAGGRGAEHRGLGRGPRRPARRPAGPAASDPRRGTGQPGTTSSARASASSDLPGRARAGRRDCPCRGVIRLRRRCRVLRRKRGRQAHRLRLLRRRRAHRRRRCNARRLLPHSATSSRS
ncbi:MAG: hypothetical protein MZW92_43095 [Comamonadaceae bacterium]|nr:hypothetical protein [Comamonadaceae bacterium]